MSAPAHQPPCRTRRASARQRARARPAHPARAGRPKSGLPRARARAGSLARSAGDTRARGPEGVVGRPARRTRRQAGSLAPARRPAGGRPAPRARGSGGRGERRDRCPVLPPAPSARRHRRLASPAWVKPGADCADCMTAPRATLAAAGGRPPPLTVGWLTAGPQRASAPQTAPEGGTSRPQPARASHKPGRVPPPHSDTTPGLTL